MNLFKPVPAYVTMSTRVMDADTQRLGLAFAAALALHAAVIFGITFVDGGGPPRAMMEVTLALHISPKPDDKADFLAAAHQQGAGQTRTARELTTVQAADFTDASVHEIRPEDRASFTPPPEEAKRRLVVTQSVSRRIPPDVPREKTPLRDSADGLLAASAQSAAIASLEARLAERRQLLAKKTRVHTVSTLSARATSPRPILTVSAKKWSAPATATTRRPPVSAACAARCACWVGAQAFRGDSGNPHVAVIRAGTAGRGGPALGPPVRAFRTLHPRDAREDGSTADHPHLALRRAHAQ